MTRYPYQARSYQTVTWKDQSIRVRAERVVLPNGRRQRDLVLPLPEHLRGAAIRKAELLWRADHYELALTVEQPPDPPLRAEGQAAGCDLGEVNVAAVATAAGEALVVNGRYLRSIKRLRGKRHATLTARLARCRKGSRRWRRLIRRKAQTAAKFYRQQRHILHTASARVAQFCRARQVARIAVGDARNGVDGADRGRKANQKVGQWRYGQFVQYLTYKLRRHGIAVDLVPEDFSTRTCSYCGHVHTLAPRGRMLRCPGCGATVHRDANAAANICSHAVFGAYGSVRVQHITYRRAADVAPRTQARPKRPVAARR